MPTCAISVDLDEIPNYLAIHGLSRHEVNRHAVYDIAVPRLLDWAAGHGIKLTFFTVGDDLAREQNARALANASQLGHEIANHSFSHFYDLTRRPEHEMFDEVVRGADAIEAAVGLRPTGFRAPGYTTTDALYRVLVRAGVSYSSSVFPCPAYWAAKVFAIGAKRLLGRASKSVVDDARVLSAPTVPYQVGTPYWQTGGGLLELPIQTTRAVRLPYIGTSLVLGGPRAADWLTRGVIGARLVNLELHGIDVLDASDGLAALASNQFDVSIPLERKFASLDRALLRLREAGYHFATLHEAAQSLTG